MKPFCFALIICTSIILSAQSSFVPIKTYRFEQLEQLQSIEKRPTMVFIQTDWCKYCQTMKNTTFKNYHIIKTLNSRFYFINLNAEDRNNIKFLNTSFKFKPTGFNTGIHELAEQLGTIKGTIAYPSLCVLNANNEIIFQYNRYINAKDLQIVLEQIK